MGLWEVMTHICVGKELNNQRVFFLPTTNWLTNFIIKCQHFNCWAAVSFRADINAEEDCNPAVEMTAFDVKVCEANSWLVERKLLNQPGSSLNQITKKNKRISLQIVYHLFISTAAGRSHDTVSILFTDIYSVHSIRIDLS